MDVLNAIGNRIMVLREADGLTQAQLARRVGVSQATVSQWESGMRAPTAEAVVALAHKARSVFPRIDRRRAIAFAGVFAIVRKEKARRRTAYRRIDGVTATGAKTRAFGAWNK